MTTNTTPISFAGPSARGVGAVRAVGFGLDPIIADGDIVLLSTTRIPEDGSIVLVEIDGELKLKVYREEHGHVFFEYGHGLETKRLLPGVYGILGVAVGVNKDLVHKSVNAPIIEADCG